MRIKCFLKGNVIEVELKGNQATLDEWQAIRDGASEVFNPLVWTTNVSLPKGRGININLERKPTHKEWMESLERWDNYIQLKCPDFDYKIVQGDVEDKLLVGEESTSNPEIPYFVFKVVIGEYYEHLGTFKKTFEAFKEQEKALKKAEDFVLELKKKLEGMAKFLSDNGVEGDDWYYQIEEAEGLHD